MNRKVRKSLAGILSVVMVLTMFMGCGSKNDTSGEMSAKTADTAMITDHQNRSDTEGGEKVLKIGELWSITSIDPVSDGTLIKEKAMVTEVLCEVDDNFNLIPGLAISWEASDDNTWVFQIKEGVTFHDGTIMDAEAVAWSIKNALAQNPNLVTQTGIESVKATGDYEVTLKTKEPNAEIPEFIHLSNFGIIAKSSYDENGHLNTVIGTGPFKIESFEVSTGLLTVVKNENYYGTIPSIDKVTLTGITDSNTRAMAIESGEVDFTCDVPYNELDRLDALDNVRIEKYDTARIYCSYFNINGMFRDKLVRQAVSLATNRQVISDEVLNGCGTVAKNMYTENMAWCNTEIDGSTYDLAQAKALMEKAGWKDSDGDGYLDKNGEIFEFTLLTYTECPGLPLIAEALQAQLKELGMKVNVTTMENAGISEQIEKGNWGMYLAGNATCMTPSCIYFLRNNYYSSNVTKYGYNNPKMDALIDQCSAEFDTEKRFEISKKIQKLAMEDLPLLYICNYGVAYGFNSSISNFKFNPTAHDYMWNVDISID